MTPLINSVQCCQDGCHTPNIVTGRTMEKHVECQHAREVEMANK